MTPISMNNPFLNQYELSQIVMSSLKDVQQSSLTTELFNFNGAAQTSFAGFDFSKLFNGSAFNFDFSNFNFDSSSASEASYTAKSGNCRPSVKLDQAFLNRVKQIAQRINCDYRDLLGVMNSESGLKSNVQNKNGGASGLIQFMPATARALGTTTNALRDMTPIQQLDYVEKFYLNNIRTYGMQGKRLTAGDLYTLTFMPAKVKGEVLCQAGSKEYAANKGLDANKDGRITKTELGNRVISKRVNESIFA